VASLLAMLERRPPKRAAIQRLRQLGETNLAQALDAAFAGDPRPAALLRDPRLAGPLEALLGDRAARRRSAAAEALGHLADPRPVPALLLALRGDPAPEVRRAAARSLGRLGDRRALGPLIDSLDVADTATRCEIASALAGIGDERALDRLATALHDYDAGVRRAAAIALGRIPNARSVAPLAAALRQERQSAVREAFVRALGQIESPARLPPLIRALDDSSDLVVIAAAHALASSGSPKAIAALTARSRWPAFRAVREACEAAIRAIREATGQWGAELAPATAPSGTGSEAVPDIPPAPDSEEGYPP